MSGRSSLAPGAVALAAPILALLALLASGGQPGPKLEKLYAEHRFFEMRTLLEPETASTPDILFYKGMTANAFNRPAESADYLASLLRTAGNQLPAAALADLLIVLADDYARMFDYAKAAETREKMLPFLDKGTSRSVRGAFISIIDFWKAMASAPPQTVEIPGDTEIAMTDAGEVPVEINGLEVPLLPDTGSAFNMIVRPEAERLGLKILDDVVEIGTATGKVIRARPCLVPELRLAGIRVRNAVFLVVPEEMLYFPEIGKQRKGLLSFPILVNLKELTFTRGGRFIVTSPPRLQGPPNFFLAGADPVVEAEYEGRRLLFFLDTGAFGSELFLPFYKAFEPDIKRRGVYEPAKIEGVGTRTKDPVYMLKGLNFLVAGLEVRFDKALPVLTRATGATSDAFDGSFSLDLMTGRQALTLSYDAMRISLR